jgi:hypothetical protein
MADLLRETGAGRTSKAGRETSSLPSFRCREEHVNYPTIMEDVKQKLEAVPVGAEPVREEFRDFAHDVDKTLELLVEALRGEKLVVRELPDLREDHHRLIRSANSEMFRFALVNEETDRMTNSLNTQRDEVLHWERLQVAADGLHDRIIRDERASS